MIYKHTKKIVLVFIRMMSVFLSGSSHSGQMTECMGEGGTENLVKQAVIFDCFV
jgi:hypothetical protein